MANITSIITRSSFDLIIWTVTQCQQHHGGSSVRPVETTGFKTMVSGILGFCGCASSVS